MDQRLIPRFIAALLILSAVALSASAERSPIKIYTSADGLGSSFVNNLRRDLRGFFLFAALVFLLLAPLMLGSPTHAETLPFKRYTTSDGLANDKVNRIVRDSRGFLWFCTGEGLSRFDGYQFKNYTRDEGLPHRSVYDLLETPQGDYWLATGDGLVLFNPEGIARRWGGFENNKTASEQTLLFRVFRPAEAKTDAWAITKLQIDAKGTLWATTSLGLYRADHSGPDWQLQRVDHSEWGDAYEFETLMRDRDGALWTAGQGGIYRILPNGTVQIISKDISIISLFQDKSGNIWAGTRGESAGGLYQYAYDGLAEPKLLHRFTRKDGLSSDFWLNAMLETSDGEFWVGVGDSLCLKTEPAKTNSSQFSAVWPNGVTSLEEDSGGNLWIGTESSGAVRLSRKGFKSFDEKDGLKSTRIASIVNGVNGDVFVLTYGGINHFDGSRFTTVMPKGMIPWNWGWNQVTFQDHAGEWWIEGTTGLQRYPRVDRFEQLARTNAKRLYTVRDGLPGNAIFRLFEDSHGDIWIGTLAGTVDSLARWERAKDKLYSYTAKDGLPAFNGPTAFAEDRFGNIWIGYYSAGVVRFHNGVF
ncbi:MAG TPA: two-component regulator propeller domain-containing protein, partial [Pyrinomonadaceae bacterium]